MPGDVIAGVLAHHRRQSTTSAGAAGNVRAGIAAGQAADPPAGYRRDSLEVLFGRRPS
jgi:hypothetical protein